MDLIDEAILRRLTLSRYLFSEAQTLSAKQQTTLQFASINLLQDSIEIFLLSAADFLNAKVQQKTPFEKYFEAIEEKLDGAELPYRKRLFEINKVRVLSKHDGVRPNREELLDHIVVTKNFLEETSELVFRRRFWGISLTELLEEGSIKDALVAAERKLQKSEFADCLVECRKAVFLTFEKDYSIWPFRNESDPSWLAQAICKAPNYTKSHEYIEKNVKEPFDYIKIDHSHLDAELLKLGLSPTLFWNVWRLTPDTVQLESDQDWLVKYEPQKSSGEDLEDRANYVFEATLDLLLAHQKNRLAAKWIQNHTDWYIVPIPGAPIFKKADSSSEVIDYIPKNYDKVSVKYSTPGLSNDEVFWYVFQSITSDGGVFDFIAGYLRASDVLESSQYSV